MKKKILVCGAGGFIGGYISKTLKQQGHEVNLAYANNQISLHAIVDFKVDGVLTKNTTVGRIIFNSILPDKLRFLNERLGKKELLTLVRKSYDDCGNRATVDFLDRLKDLGFVTELGRRLDVPLKLATLVEQMFLASRERYGGDAWTPHVVKMMEEATGEELRAEGFPDVIPQE